MGIIFQNRLLIKKIIPPLLDDKGIIIEQHKTN